MSSAVLSPISIKENKEDFNMNTALSPRWLVFYWGLYETEYSVRGPIIYTGKNVSFTLRRLKAAEMFGSQ